MMIGSISRACCLLAVMLLVSGCDVLTDGATRIAYQIEAEAGAFRTSDKAVHTIVHLPERKGGAFGGNGCAEAYTVQFDKVGAIIIWCKDSKSGLVTGSHSTSYASRFIETPQTWVIDKRAGESTYIELRKTADKPMVTNVR